MTISKCINASLFALCFIAMSGCAGVTTKPIGRDDGSAKGIRHYGYKAPFILLTQRTDGGVDSSLIYLPDTTTIYSTRPYAFLSDNKTRLNFSKGVLEYSKSEINETKLPVLSMKIVSALAEKAAKVFMPLSLEGKPTQAQKIGLASPALFRVFVGKENALMARGKYNGNDITVSLATATVQPTQHNQKDGEK